MKKGMKIGLKRRPFQVHVATKTEHKCLIKEKQKDLSMRVRDLFFTAVQAYETGSLRSHKVHDKSGIFADNYGSYSH